MSYFCTVIRLSFLNFHVFPDGAFKDKRELLKWYEKHKTQQLKSSGIIPRKPVSEVEVRESGLTYGGYIC